MSKLLGYRVYRVVNDKKFLVSRKDEPMTKQQASTFISKMMTNDHCAIPCYEVAK